MSNRVDPDETAHNEASHLDLRCLQNLLLQPMAVKALKVDLFSDGAWCAETQTGSHKSCRPWKNGKKIHYVYPVPLIVGEL